MVCAEDQKEVGKRRESMGSGLLWGPGVQAEELRSDATGMGTIVFLSRKDPG